MNIQDFEEICNGSKFTILPKHFTPDGNILLAERFKPEPVAHYETLWAVERDGCDYARFVRNNAFWFGTPVDQSKRIADAVEDAMQWMKDNLTVGRYNK